MVVDDEHVSALLNCASIGRNLRVAQEKILTQDAFKNLVDGDIEWLERQPRTLEREHILMILRDAVRLYYQ